MEPAARLAPGALSGIDALIVLTLAGYALLAGFRARREASEGLESYFLASRSLDGWRAGLSMAATQFAADTPLLVTGLIATAGIFSLWRLWIYALAFLLLGFLLAPCWRRARVVTDAELAELRYGSRGAAWLRAAKAVYFGTIFNCVVLAMVLFAAKEIAEPFLPWHRWLPAAFFEPLRAAAEGLALPFASGGPGAADLWTRSADNWVSLMLLLGVTGLYSASGGLRGVVRTDVVQLALMLGATAVYAAIVLAETGGPAALAARLAELYPATGVGISASEILAFTPSRAEDAGLALLAVLALQWLVQMNADGTGYLAQRAMACRSDADAVRATLVFSVVQILLRSLIWLPIGVGLLVLFPAEPGAAGAAFVAERERSFVRGMAELLPAGVRGAMLAAMLAALASTIDTHVNWGASYWSNDLYGRFYRAGWRGRPASPRALVRVARLSSVAILAVALAVMTQLASIQTAWHASLLLGAGMGVTLVLRWLWWRITAWGELAAIAASLLLAPVALWWSDAEAVRLLWVALGSTTAAVATSLAGPAEPREQLVAFYARVRPPGFWGPIARELAGDPDAGRRRLVRGLAATGLSAFSLFCALTGLGTALVLGTPPAWLPWRAAWVALLLGLAALTAPLAWRVAAPLLRR